MPSLLAFVVSYFQRPPSRTDVHHFVAFDARVICKDDQRACPYRGGFDIPVASLKQAYEVARENLLQLVAEHRLGKSGQRGCDPEGHSREDFLMAGLTFDKHMPDTLELPKPVPQGNMAYNVEFTSRQKLIASASKPTSSWLM